MEVCEPLTISVRIAPSSGLRIQTQPTSPQIFKLRLRTKQERGVLHSIVPCVLTAQPRKWPSQLVPKFAIYLTVQSIVRHSFSNSIRPEYNIVFKHRIAHHSAWLHASIRLNPGLDLFNRPSTLALTPINCCVVSYLLFL